MVPLQAVKCDSMIIPQAVETTPVTGIMDTLGGDCASIICYLDTAAASSVITTLAITEGDTTSTFSAITAFTGGVAAGNFTLPVPNTSTPDIVRFDIDTRARKRYLKVTFTSPAARLCSVMGLLSRNEGMPDTAAKVGVTTWVRG